MSRWLRTAWESFRAASSMTKELWDLDAGRLVVDSRSFAIDDIEEVFVDALALQFRDYLRGVDYTWAVLVEDSNGARCEVARADSRAGAIRLAKRLRAALEDAKQHRHHAVKTYRV